MKYISNIVKSIKAIKNVAIEKESRLKEYMLMMGLTRTCTYHGVILRTSNDQNARFSLLDTND